MNLTIDNNEEVVESSSSDIEMAALTEHDDQNTGTAVNDYTNNENAIAAKCNADFNCVTLGTVSYARRLLYGSHLVAEFSEISWQFSVALFLAATTNYQSLVLVSTYGIVVAMTVCCGSVHLGRWIDCTDRLVVARRLVLGENVAVILGTVCSFFLLMAARNEGDTELSQTTNNESTAILVGCLDDSSDGVAYVLHRWFAYVPTNTQALLAMIGVHICGALAQVLDQAFTVAVERDWVVVMAQAATVAARRSPVSSNHSNNNDDQKTFKDWLTETNVAMKQIDLNCKIVAPALAGMVMAALSGGGSRDGHDQDGSAAESLKTACIFVGVLNGLSLLVEYVCTFKIYQLIPALAGKDSTTRRLTVKSTCMTPNSDHDSEISEPIVILSPGCLPEWVKLPQALRVYTEYPVCWGGIGLSLLYMNALTFGNGIISAFLLYHHVALGTVGILRGVASAIGLLGTFVYHFSTRRLSLEATAMWSVTFQFTCLFMILLTLGLVRDKLAIAVLVGCVCLSRVGLWVFDIAITQMQQQEIPEHTRGLVGGVQQALNAFFQCLSFTLGLVFPRPRDFVYFVLAGTLSVGLAMVLYAYGIFWPRCIYRSRPDV